MNINWGANDYCKVLSNQMVHQYMSLYGTDLKGLFNDFGFNQREVEQIKNVDDFVGLLLKDSNITQKMRALLEAGQLRVTHPRKQDYEWGYPRRIPSRLLALPQASRGLNFRLLMLLFMSTVPGVKGLMNMTEVEMRCSISENSEFLKKRYTGFFKKTFINLSSLDPNAAVSVIGEPIERGTSFYHVQFHTLVFNNFFHQILMDYVSARQLAYAKEEGVELLYEDYTVYLNNKAEDDRMNLSKKSFQGIDPYDWEESLVTDYVLDCSRISEEAPKKSLMKSLKEQKNAVPILQQLLAQESKSESRIIEQDFLHQFETPTRKPVNESIDQKLSSDIELYGNTQQNNNNKLNTHKQITNSFQQTVNINSHQSNEYLIVVNWNVSSLKLNTLVTIKQYCPHIICLQEIRNKVNSSPQYNFINKLRKSNNQGGGLAVGVHKQFIIRDISNCLQLINLEYQLIQCTCKTLELILLNLYSPQSSGYRYSTYQKEF